MAAIIFGRLFLMMGNWIADSATIARTARGKVLLIGEGLVSCIAMVTDPDGNTVEFLQNSASK